MDPKEYLTNKKFCPIPWTGFMYFPSGEVLNCIRSQRAIGNLKDNSIHEILDGNTETKQRMLDGEDGLGCNNCYELEGDKQNFDVISDRIFYLKELKSVDNTLYDNPNDFDLHTIDIRWSTVCNHACVYCSPEYSSKWATELNIQPPQVPEYRVQELKQLVYDKAEQLKHVYMAGGEPLLMKENLELLEILKQKNPNVNLRVNTNLSKTGTRVFEKICEFPNVHWTVSLDTIEEQFEYIRYGGVWQDFLDNLKIITKLDHKVSFNMLWYAMNYKSIFSTVDYLKQLGYHDNSFIIGPTTQPQWQDVRHLPDNVLNELKIELENRLKTASFLLKDSYTNMLSWLNDPFEKDVTTLLKHLEILDQRRGLDSKILFSEMYKCLHD